MSVRDSHDKAMDFAEHAFVARLHGQQEQAHDFFVQALKYELEAIAQLEEIGERIEPTYSVLHRSAATLALDCNQPEKAKEIATKALNQNPHPEIAVELRELLLRISMGDSDFKDRAARADKEVFTRLLETAGQEPPRPGDEILPD